MNIENTRADQSSDAKIAAHIEDTKARSHGRTTDGHFDSAGGPHNPRHGAVEERRADGPVPGKKEHLGHVSRQLEAKAAAGIAPSHRDRGVLHKHHIANGHTASQARGHADRLAGAAANARNSARTSAGTSASTNAGNGTGA